MSDRDMDNRLQTKKASNHLQLFHASTDSLSTGQFKIKNNMYKKSADTVADKF